MKPWSHTAGKVQEGTVDNGLIGNFPVEGTLSLLLSFPLVVVMSRKAGVERRRTGADKRREHYERNGKYGRAKVEERGLVEPERWAARPAGKPKRPKARRWRVSGDNPPEEQHRAG